jgi:hypothetical protein
VSPGVRKARTPAAPVTFRGPPHRLSSLVRLPTGADELGEPKASLEGAEIRGLSIRLLSGKGLDMGKLTLRLPKSTPPGSYAGSVELGGRPVPVRVDVEPRPRLEASPSRLAFEVEPGAEATATVTLLNVGNVPFEVPAASKFCVFDGGGVDYAFFVAFVSDPPESKRRIDVLLDELAGSHGGLVELRARAASRVVAPGEAQDVDLTFSFSDRLRPGHDYAGSWDAEGLHVRIRVSVPGGKPTQRTRREAR